MYSDHALFNELMDQLDSLDEPTKINESSLDSVRKIQSDLTMMSHGSRKTMTTTILFEQFLDMNNVYFYHGWDDAEFIDAIDIKKYMVFADIKVPRDTDFTPLKAIYREYGGLSFKITTTTHDYIIFKLGISKNFLDELEAQNLEAQKD